MNFLKLKSNRNLFYLARKYSKDVKVKSSREIRQEFLDFFTNSNGHKFIRSSSVIPFCDPTLSFTNAGMNQFKNILIGNQKPAHRRVANSQKCIRVGGKHNDLSIVGSDTYHHTFFEMLGNWSFGDYFKKEACEMAWTLLTKVYKIPPARIYVSYFNGDENLNLPPDLECKEIWREIGVREDRIIGFGTRENFWEMGATGPCGGCTEIHIDLAPTFESKNRAKDVNGDFSDLIELWNLVFIEYFRHSDGSITKLPEKHVDTGMGFERLVAFLQNKNSNYDTDLFTPIFKRIAKETGAPDYTGNFNGFNIDTAYRIVADHSRMTTVSLADGMFPEENQKLRRILRKSILLSEKYFKKENLLLDIVPEVADILGETYPEIHKNLNLVREIVKYETDLYKSLRSSTTKEIQNLLNHNPHLIELDVYEYSGFSKGYQEIIDHKKVSNVLDGNLLFKLYDTHGLDMEFLEKLAETENMALDREGFEKIMMENKKKGEGTSESSKVGETLDALKLRATENNSKFNYRYNKETKLYESQTVKGKVLGIFTESQESISDTKHVKGKVQLIFNKSPFYYESGGQESDNGWIISKDGRKLDLKRIFNRKEILVHEIEVDQLDLKVGDEVLLQIDEKKRSNLIKNHSGVHLLNAAVRKLTKSPIYQKSSFVSSDSLKLELAILGRKLSLSDLEKLENLLRKCIQNQNLQGCVKIINSMELLAEDDVMVPGEIYPENNIRLVTFGSENTDLVSKELCCGTHALNSEELENFVLLNVKSTGKNSFLFVAATGNVAENAIHMGNEIFQDLSNLKSSMTKDKIENVMKNLQRLKSNLKRNDKIGYLQRKKCEEMIAEIKEFIKIESRNVLSELLEVEMKTLKTENSNSDFVIHNLDCAEWMKTVSLSKATRYLEDRPIMLFSVSDETLKARCCVPSGFINEEFTAEQWLASVAQVFKSSVSAPKGQNPRKVCNMKGKRISSDTIEEQIQEATSVATDYANKFMNKKSKKISQV